MNSLEIDLTYFNSVSFVAGPTLNTDSLESLMVIEFKDMTVA